jgi:hypothetical protein
MTARRRSRDPRTERPPWPALPTRAWRLARSADDARSTALEHAVNRSPLQARVDDIERFLDLAEPWVDRDILLAHLLAERDPPPDALYVLVGIPEAPGVITQDGWSLLPECRAGTRETQVFVVGLSEAIYALGVAHGGAVIGLLAEWIRLHLGRRDLDYDDAARWIRARLVPRDEETRR